MKSILIVCALVVSMSFIGCKDKEGAMYPAGSDSTMVDSLDSSQVDSLLLNQVDSLAKNK